MGVFEKYLSLWIALAMAAGIGIGTIAPGLVTAVAAAEGRVEGSAVHRAAPSLNSFDRTQRCAMGTVHHIIA